MLRIKNLETKINVKQELKNKARMMLLINTILQFIYYLPKQVF